MSQENVDNAQRALDAFARRDRDAWVELCDPDIEIVDAHHHIWDLPGNRYVLEDFAAAAATGHNVVETVFEECVSMYRATGAKHMAPVGEVEFAAGVAAMADARGYTNVRVAAGIVG